MLDEIYSREPGTYMVKVTNFKEFPAVMNLTDPDPDSDSNTSHIIDPSLPADAVIRNPYVLIETSDPLITIKLFSSRVPYFMKAINRQFNWNLSGLKLSQVLKYLEKHEFKIQLTYHPRYGEQIDFRAE